MEPFLFVTRFRSPHRVALAQDIDDIIQAEVAGFQQDHEVEEQIRRLALERRLAFGHRRHGNLDALLADLLGRAFRRAGHQPADIGALGLVLLALADDRPQMREKAQARRREGVAKGEGG